MNQNGTKLCKQGQLNGYTYCFRQLLDESSIAYNHTADVTKLNHKKVHNSSFPNEDNKLFNSGTEVSFVSKKERRNKKERGRDSHSPSDGKLKFADRLRALLKKEGNHLNSEGITNAEDPYTFSEPSIEEGSEVLQVSTSLPKPLPAFTTLKPLLDQKGDSENGTRSEQLQAKIIGATPPTLVTTTQTTTTGGQDAKSKSTSNTTTKLSKTMNRLQAKIAQNKLLDKLKKAQDSSQQANNLLPLPQATSQRIVPPVSCVKLEVKPLERQRFHPTFSPLFQSSVPLGSPIVSHVIGQRTTHPVEVKQESVDSNKKPPPPCGISRLKEKLAKPKTKVTDTPNGSTNGAAGTLQRLQEFWWAEKKRQKNACLGYESFESEQSEDDDESSFTWHRPSLWNFNLDYNEAAALKSIRILKIHHLKSELSKTYEHLCKRHVLFRQELQRQNTLVQCLCEAARHNPNRTAQILLSNNGTKPQKSIRPIGLEKRKCCYHHDSISCSKPALPYTRHCIRHIMYNVDQLLFEHCTAKFADNTQCCVPVFDVCHELPLCPEHAKKRDNYNKMASEPKPKKARKKSKTPALTRPQKRGKKKKQRPNNLRPSPSPPLPTQAPASVAVSVTATAPSQPPPSSAPPPQPQQLPVQPQPSVPQQVLSQEAVVTSSAPAPAVVPAAVPQVPVIKQEAVEEVSSIPVSTTVTEYSIIQSSGEIKAEPIKEEIDEPLESDIGSDLETQFSPGTIDKSLELPLDAAELANQATKLLEEHDFTEVLNKISDDAFNDFFAESKNGEYVPTKEETEELERALAAVSKDVHLAKESLAKLSGSSSQEMEELADLQSGLLSGAIDDHTFSDLNLTSSDLNSLTQALSSMAAQGNPEVLQTVSLLSSELASQPPTTSSPQFLGASLLEGPTHSVESTFIPSLGGINSFHNSTSSMGSNSEPASTTGSAQWLLTADHPSFSVPPQVTYQNGLMLASGSSFTNVHQLFKFPVQAEVALVSSGSGGIRPVSATTQVVVKDGAQTVQKPQRKPVLAQESVS